MVLLFIIFNCTPYISGVHIHLWTLNGPHLPLTVFPALLYLFRDLGYSDLDNLPGSYLFRSGIKYFLNFNVVLCVMQHFQIYISTSRVRFFDPWPNSENPLGYTLTSSNVPPICRSMSGYCYAPMLTTIKLGRTGRVLYINYRYRWHQHRSWFWSSILSETFIVHPLTALQTTIVINVFVCIAQELSQTILAVVDFNWGRGSVP